MLNASDAFKSAIMQNNRELFLRATVGADTLSKGVIKNCNYIGRICGESGSGLSCGEACASSITLNLQGIDPKSLSGAEIVLEIGMAGDDDPVVVYDGSGGVELSSKSGISAEDNGDGLVTLTLVSGSATFSDDGAGTVTWSDTNAHDAEFIPLGTFTVTTITSADDFVTTEVTAYDDMLKAEITYEPTVTFPATLEDVLVDTAAQCGIELDANGYAGYESLVIEGVKDPYTCRQMFGFIAGMMGRNAYITRDRKLSFRWFTDAGFIIDRSSVYVGGFQRTTLDPIEFTAILTGTVDDDTNAQESNGEEETDPETGTNVISRGTGRAVRFANPFITDAMADAVYEQVNGSTYQPSTTRYRGNPLVECGDIVHIADSNGDPVTVYVMEHTLHFDGGLYGTITAHGVSDEDAALDEGAGTTDPNSLILEVKKMVHLVAEKADIDLANIDTANIAQAFIDAVFAKDVTATGTIKGATLEGAKIIGGEIDISADVQSSDGATVHTIIETGFLTATGNVPEPTSDSAVSLAVGVAADEGTTGTGESKVGGTGEAESTMTESQMLQNRYVRLYSGNPNSSTDVVVLPNKLLVRGNAEFSNGDTPYSALELDADSDLDDLKTPGFYVFTQEASQTIGNIPIGGAASGSVVIIPEGTLGQVRQQVTRCSAGNREIWERLWYNDAWSDWVLLYSPHAIPTAPAMTARNDAEQTLTSTTTTRVNMAYSRWATSNAANFLSLTGNGIKCLKAGYVEVSAKLLFKNGFEAGDHLRAWIYQNSTAQYAASIHAATTASYYTVSLSPFVVSVSAGDVIYLYGQAERANTIIGYESAAHSCQLTVKYIG